MDTIETHIFENGQYVPVRRTRDEILKQYSEAKRRTKEKEIPNQPGPTAIGLLSTTQMHSPVVKQILPARIRGSLFNDLLFIGEDIVHITEIQPTGSIKYIGNKTGFSSRIRVAAVIGKRLEDHEDTHPPFNGNSMSTSSEDRSPNVTELPPQILVLSLASGELLFLFARYNRELGTLSFVQSHVPMPLGRLPLLQPGRYLAVDPLNRAIAVASTGGTIIVYKLKDRERLQQEFNSLQGYWRPVEDDIFINTEGIILQLDFLTPSLGDDQQMILAVIVNNKEAECGINCYEIDVTESLALTETVIVKLKIEAEYRATILLIPASYSPDFLLVSGHKVAYWKNILTGSPAAECFSPQAPLDEPIHPASSLRLPIYTAWTRGERHHKQWKEQKNEAFYLVRDDGVIHQIGRARESLYTIARAGSFACQASTAFTSFLASDKYRDPDYLIVAGESSEGQIIQIGLGTPTLSQPPKSRSDVMKPQHVDWIPNWAPISDLKLVSTSTPNGDASYRSSIYMTSGAQPYGAVSELRIGIEALINISLELMEESEMAKFTNLCPLNIETPSGSETLIFFSTTDETLVIHYNDNDEVRLVEGSVELQDETLTAVLVDGECILHVSSRRVALYSVKEDSGAVELDMIGCHVFGDRILRASYLETHTAVLIGVQKMDGSCSLQLFIISRTSDGPMLEAFTGELKIPSYPTAMKLFRHSNGFGALVADGRGLLQLYQIQEAPNEFKFIRELPIPKGNHEQDITLLAESIEILSDVNGHEGYLRSMVILGLRDGRIWKIGSSGYRSEQALNLLHGQPSLVEEVERHLDPQMNSSDFLTIGYEPIRILPQYLSSTSTVLLSCGSDVCQLEYQGGGIRHLLINSVWFRDQSQPYLVQPSFTAMALHRPMSFAHISQARLFGITGSSLLVAGLDPQRKSVSRRIALEETDHIGTSSVNMNGVSNAAGTPRELLVFQHLNLMAVATTIWEVLPKTRIPQQSWRGRRIVRGAIKFLRLDDPAATVSQSAFRLLPGERISSMDEWSDLARGRDEKSAYLVIGTMYALKSSEPKGRILFLKVWLDDDDVPSLKVIKVHLYNGGPVTAVRSLNTSTNPTSHIFDPYSSGRDGTVNESDQAGENKFVRLSGGQLATDRPTLAVAVAKKLDIYALDAQDHAQSSMDTHQTTAGAVTQPKLHRIASELLDSHAIRIAVYDNTFISLVTMSDSWRAYTLDEAHTLKLKKSDEIVRMGIDHTHLTFREPCPPGLPIERHLEDKDAWFSMILISDREDRIAGLQARPPEQSVGVACRTLFSAKLPQAIVRFACGNIRPAWRRKLATGIKANNILGATANGTFYGFSILDEHALRLLQFLQNLVKYHNQGLRFKANQYHGEPTIIDPEFAKRKQTASDAMNYVNGDTLLPLLERDGRRLLEEMLQTQHWELASTAAHYGNNVENRLAKFDELVKKLGADKPLHGLEDFVDFVVDWLRVVLAPLL